MTTLMEKLRTKVRDKQEREARAERTGRAAAEFKHALASRNSALLAGMPVPKNNLEAKQQLRELGALKGPHQLEMERILALPVVEPMTTDELEAFSREHVLAEAFDNKFRLWRTQAEGFDAFIKTGGLLGPIAVGWGKTLLGLMIANYAFTKQGVRKIVLLLPPEVLTQFEHDLKWARTRVPFATPVYILGSKTLHRRRLLAASNKRGLYVMPYSLLSTKDTEANLKDIQPGLIVADEAHKVCRAVAVRTKRLRRYMTAHPDCQVVAMSGTITSKSLRDYWHLAKAACGKYNPLPNIMEMTNEWSEKLDAKASSNGSPGPLRMLSRWAEKQCPKEEFPFTTGGFRKAFRLRLVTSPAVVSSGEAEITTSLLFKNRKLLLLPEHENSSYLQSLIKKVVEKWETPNGDEIEYAMHSWKWLFELSAGFYNELFWPSEAVLARRKSWKPDKTKSVLQRSRDYFAAGQIYAKELRDFLKIGRVGLDTPMAVGSFMSQKGPDCMPRVPRSVYEAWRDMKALDFHDRIDRDARAVRICPYKIDEAAQWAKELNGEGGIIWYYHQEIGEWLHESLTKVHRFKNVLHCPAGANKQILDPANVKKIILASISAHHTGKNLQHFHNQLVVQWPRPANTAEQMLGRTHRNGQEADELVVNLLHSLDWDYLNFAACINDALYIHQTTGNRQKLVYGDFAEPPRIYAPEVLKALGCDPKMLNAEQRLLMQETYGDYQ